MLDVLDSNEVQYYNSKQNWGLDLEDQTRLTIRSETLSILGELRVDVFRDGN